MTLLQHLPGFVDASPHRAIGTLEEILALPWVRTYSEFCEQPRIMRARDKPWLLVDGLKDGQHWWWVIGYMSDVTDAELASLPEWPDHLTA